jgi:hypothetical protein
VKRRLIIFGIVAILITITAILLNKNKYAHPGQLETQYRVNYLTRVLSSHWSDELTALGKQNPEWVLFSYSFSAYALTNIAASDSAFKPAACKFIEMAVGKMLDENLSEHFRFEGENGKTSFRSSVLYLGHLNLTLGCLRYLSENSTYNKLNDSISALLYEQYIKSKSFCLESYPGGIWIPDNTVALASLYLHSQNTGSNYKQACKDWVNFVRLHYTEKETGLLYSTVSPENVRSLEVPRGSMIGWSILFIYRFDPAFAKELYENYKSCFSTNYLVVRPFKEIRGSWKSGAGDVDSGPLFLGYSAPASTFALGDAIAMRDYVTAEKISNLIAIFSGKKAEGGEMKFKTRFYNVSVSPMTEAVLLYMETMKEWISKKEIN